MQRVNLCISPKGIQMTDQLTGESLMRVSIYKISYCSADAHHGDVFAFVGTEEQSLDSRETDEQLICYAFLCAKRKIAQKVTLTVARSFEQAYQIWREAAERKQYQLEIRNRENKRQHVNAKVASCTSNSSKPTNGVNGVLAPNGTSSDIRNLLIDFSSEITAEICARDHRDLLQNTWVSFDDSVGQTDGGIHHRNDGSNAWGSNKLVNCA